MIVNFNYLTVLRYAICVHMLSGSLFTENSVRALDVKRKCIKNVNSTSELSIICPKETDRIEVVFMNYLYLKEEDFPSSCTAVSSQCNKLMRTGLELKKQGRYFHCSEAKKRCRGPVGKLPQPPQYDDHCPNIISFNFLLMEYGCIPETDFIDLCGDVDVNITSTVKHLAYFRKNSDDPFQDCTCSIQGPHNLTAVNADIPSSLKNDCKPVNIWINAVYTNLSESNTNISQPKEQLINVDFNRLQSSHIRMIRNCISDEKVWFKIKPAEGETVRIQCGESINKPSSARSPEPSSPRTTTTDSTSEGTQLNTTEVENRNRSSTVATTSLPNTTEKSQLPLSTDQMTSTSTIITTVATTSLPNTTEKSQLSLTTDQVTSTSTIITTVATTSLPNTTEKSQLSLTTDQVTSKSAIISTVATTSSPNTTEKSQLPLSTDQMTSTSTIISTLATTSLPNTTEKSQLSLPTDKMTSTNTIITTVATISLPNTIEKSQLPLSTDQMNITSTIITTLSDTSIKDPEQNTLPQTGENTKVPVIVGSVIGALVLILILIVIGILVYRRKRREKSPSGLGTVVNNTYNFDEVNAGNHQTYPNNAFEEGTPAYSSVGETKTTNDNNDRFTSAESSTDYDLLKPATVFQTFSYQNKKATGEQHDDVTLYDHLKKQTKGGHNILPGDDVKDSDYDVLESKPNLNSSFDKVDTLDDDTYNHIDGNHKDPSDTTDQVMPKTETKNVVKSAPEYATVNKHGVEQEQTGSAAGDGNNAKLDSTGNSKDTNIYHILEEPTTPEIQTGSDN